MKIHIMGASCAGSTTLGQALALKLSYPYFDTDDYFWLPSDPPYELRRDPAERKQMLQTDVANYTNCIVGGSLVHWGDEWLTAFNLVVFLYIPHDIRIQRLKCREAERYGDKIFTDPESMAKYEAFVNWASGYDDNTTNGRNLNAHQSWLKQLICPVLYIEGDTTVDERVGIVMDIFSKGQNHN